MMKHNQDGAINGIVVSLVLAIILLIAAIAFGGWAYSSRQDYKKHTDLKIQAAVVIAQQKESTVKDKVFAEILKNPLKIYSGPEAYGSMILNYPKTWSGYVDDTGTSSNLVNGYFAPGVVPSINNQASVYALRLQVLSQTYSQTLQSFVSQQQSGNLTISAYTLPKLPNIIGVQVVGKITGTSNQTMIVLPLRAETIEISTQGNQYLTDFTKYILPNFSFSP